MLINLQENFKRIGKEKEKDRAAGDPDNRRTERTPQKCLDVDLKITLLQNVQIHQSKMRNVEIKYVLMKKVIVHATTARITVTKRYMHI